MLTNPSRRVFDAYDEIASDYLLSLNGWKTHFFHLYRLLSMLQITIVVVCFDFGIR